jgi:hypothetical protein
MCGLRDSSLQAHPRLGEARRGPADPRSPPRTSTCTTSAPPRTGAAWTVQLPGAHGGHASDRADRVAGTTKPALLSVCPGQSGFRMSGAEGIRTPDLLIANETRYQLRHSPKCVGKVTTAPGVLPNRAASGAGLWLLGTPPAAGSAATTPLYKGPGRPQRQAPAALRSSSLICASTSTMAAAISSALRASSLSAASWPEEVMPVISMVRTVRRARALLT